MPAPELSVEERLDELQRQSEERRWELREIAAQLPAGMSRRAILWSMAADFRHAPGKGDIVVRMWRKAARAPRQAYLALRHRWRQPPP
jgi:hypothetical protein